MGSNNRGSAYTAPNQTGGDQVSTKSFDADRRELLRAGSAAAALAALPGFALAQGLSI
jgi:hypothetical protein